MKCSLKFSLCIAISAGIFSTGYILPAATENTKTKTVPVSSCCPKQTVKKQYKPLPRGYKLREKHNKELMLLKDIHSMQSYFLTQFDGTNSKINEQERERLKLMINELPSSIKKSAFPYLERMAYMEYTVYSILSGKEKYSGKKKFDSPEKLLKDIQKKQRTYLLKIQKREQKKLN